MRKAELWRATLVAFRRYGTPAAGPRADELRDPRVSLPSQTASLRANTTNDEIGDSPPSDESHRRVGQFDLAELPSVTTNQRLDLYIAMY